MIGKSDGATASFNEYYGASSDSYVGGTGGQTTTSGNFKFHYFNSSGTLSLSSTGQGDGSNTVDYIIIAGGGGGGQEAGGGGGAGGYLTGTFSASATEYSVTVGV